MVPGRVFGMSGLVCWRLDLFWGCLDLNFDVCSCIFDVWTCIVCVWACIWGAWTCILGVWTCILGVWFYWLYHEWTHPALCKEVFHQMKDHGENSPIWTEFGSLHSAMLASKYMPVPFKSSVLIYFWRSKSQSICGWQI